MPLPSGAMRPGGPAAFVLPVRRDATRPQGYVTSTVRVEVPSGMSPAMRKTPDMLSATAVPRQASVAMPVQVAAAGYPALRPPVAPRRVVPAPVCIGGPAPHTASPSTVPRVVRVRTSPSPRREVAPRADALRLPTPARAVQAVQAVQMPRPQLLTGASPVRRARVILPTDRSPKVSPACVKVEPPKLEPKVEPPTAALEAPTQHASAEPQETSTPEAVEVNEALVVDGGDLVSPESGDFPLQSRISQPPPATPKEEVRSVRALPPRPQHAPETPDALAQRFMFEFLPDRHPVEADGERQFVDECLSRVALDLQASGGLARYVQSREDLVRLQSRLEEQETENVALHILRYVSEETLQLRVRRGGQGIFVQVGFMMSMGNKKVVKVSCSCDGSEGLLSVCWDWDVKLEPKCDN
mmetsp:Transcript_73079/g.171369  ORF Transcript_73079/g.171369 Transcript_73079/m.171369 type:complete len:413 (+) Transcript_73079:139-1377(+)